MSEFKCWGSRGLLGNDLVEQIGAMKIDASIADFRPNDIVINARESSSKQLAESNIYSFLVESASKSIQLYNSLNGSSARLIYFSTIDFNDSNYCQMKRWLETLPGRFLERSMYKIVRLPGIVGSTLRKGPVFDIINSRIFNKSNLTLNIIDTQEIARYTQFLDKNWEEEPVEVNLTPLKPIALCDIWLSVHRECRCEMPEVLKRPIDESLFQAKSNQDSNFSLNSSEYYVNRFLKDYDKFCYK